MIRVKYNQDTTFVEANYSSLIQYPSIIVDEESKTIDGSPYIEITNKQHQDNLGNTMCVIDGVYQRHVKSNSTLLEEERKYILERLKQFHNSESTRTLRINNAYDIYLFGEYRALVAEQINNIKIQIEEGNIAADDAVFNYYYNGDDSYIPVSFMQLKTIYIAMMNIVNANYVIYKRHIKNIKELTSKTAIKNYDFTEGYLINQNIDI